MPHTMKRRSLLAGSVAGLVLLAAVWAGDSKPPEETIAFFVIGDTHLLADKKEPEKMDERSAALTAGLIDALNKLPGTEIAKEAGGGSVLAPRGVIHAGDCIDSGNLAGGKMQQTEWNAFAQGFGLTGKDGRLKFPLYEVHGNHDAVRSENLATKQIVQRNKTRPGVTNLSKNGLHYSWDWGNVHFVNLGIIVGSVDDVARKRRYDPFGSLEFLIADLKDKVGKSGRPVVITHHVDMLRYSQPLPIEDKKAEAMEWDPADVRAYFEALRGYNIAAILYGHTHGRNVYRWNGTTKAAQEGIPVFNVSKSSHFAGKQQAFFYIEIRGNAVTVREYQTTDAWQTGSWTPKSWTAALVAPASTRRSVAMPTFGHRVSPLVCHAFGDTDTGQVRDCSHPESMSVSRARMLSGCHLQVTTACKPSPKAWHPTRTQVT